MSDYDCMNPVIYIEESEPEEHTPKVTVFDIINDINTHGQYIKNYLDTNKNLPPEFNSYIILRAFANFKDTVVLANEMNKKMNLIPDECKWRFLSNTVSKRKRFSKWFKSLDDEEPITLLAQYFDCSVKEMYKNVNVLSDEQKMNILKLMNPEKYNKKQNAKKTNSQK